jgi:hypothetical protein
LNHSKLASCSHMQGDAVAGQLPGAHQVPAKGKVVRVNRRLSI